MPSYLMLHLKQGGYINCLLNYELNQTKALRKGSAVGLP